VGSDSHILAEISRRHHCDRCGKACFIDPGPPPVHKPFSMEQLSVWTSLVVCPSLKHFLCAHVYRLHQKLKSTTIDKVPDILQLPKRKDREPLPPLAANPSQGVSNTMTTNPTYSTVTAGSDSQNYTHLNHLGFPMHGFPSIPPAFPMQAQAYPYPMPNYMPAPMYAPPYYGYPFAHQGATHATSAMQPNGYPALPLMHMPNYPMPTPMYAPPAASGYPFAPAAPPGLDQGANVDSGRKRQFSVSDPQASGSDPIEAGIPGPNLNTDQTLNDWLNDTELDNMDSEA
jgi:hypothetical protein